MTPIHRLMANVVLASGALIVLLCGGCTVLLLGTSIVAMVRGADPLAIVTIGLVAIIGGVPTLLGVLLIGSGLRRRKPAGKAPPATFD